MIRLVLLSLVLNSQGGVEAQSNHALVFTHAETCHPLSTGMISNSPVFTARNLTAHFTAQREASFRGFYEMGQHLYQMSNPCHSFANLMYRTADGSCNNHYIRGQSRQPLARLLPPDYADGLQAPRSFSVLGNHLPLPSPRLVSRVVHRDVIGTSHLTLFVMQWGQFMDHEMVSTPLPIEDTRGTITCCGDNAGPPVTATNRECYPILFAPGDPDFRGTCMEFVRSQPINDSYGNMILPRENENLITTFIDGSNVYGSTEERQERLRDSRRRYLLRTTHDNFPPDNGMDDCVKRHSGDVCFLAGDDRVNEHPALTLLHTIFVRYHNILASELQHCRPDAPHELIFQQARAIVGAVMQNIMYSEWVPIVLGPSVRTHYGLDLNRYCRTKHDPNVDPRIFTSFSTAVFRFGHTLIPRSLPMAPNRRVLLRELFFKPYEARDNLDSLAAGLIQSAHPEDRSQPPDQFCVSEVTSHLFENQEGVRKGFDLVSLNIQRGRDHGLPSYNSFRKALGLRPVTTFADPALGTAGADLAKVYAHVDDIDLFSGGMSEPPFEGGLVGETFSRLMGLQLHRVKYGDRFFFDNQITHFGFTDEQVSHLRQIRLAHVLCLTTRLPAVQLDVFRAASPANPPVSCDRLREAHPKPIEFSHYPICP